jgi:hypothetical protein
VDVDAEFRDRVHIRVLEAKAWMCDITTREAGCEEIVEWSCSQKPQETKSSSISKIRKLSANQLLYEATIKKEDLL